jgi:hypothetical protein
MRVERAIKRKRELERKNRKEEERIESGERMVRGGCNIQRIERIASLERE